MISISLDDVMNAKKDPFPQTLINLFEYFRKKDKTPDQLDILSGLSYICMLEVGFIDATSTDYQDCTFNHKKLIHLTESFPGLEKTDRNLYKMQLHLPQLENYSVQVLCYQLGTDFITNCSVNNLRTIRLCLLLDSLTYFTKSVEQVEMNKLQNLRYFSYKFKSEIAYKVKECILKHTNTDFYHLETLPTPIINKVLDNFHDLKDWISFAKSSSKLVDHIYAYLRCKRKNKIVIK